MKKLISILLSLILLLSVTACSDKNGGESSGTEKPSAETQKLPELSTKITPSADNDWLAIYRNYMAIGVNETSLIGEKATIGEESKYMDFTVAQAETLDFLDPQIYRPVISSVIIGDKTIASVSSEDDRKYKITGLKAGKTTITAIMTSVDAENGDDITLHPIRCEFDLYVLDPTGNVVIEAENAEKPTYSSNSTVVNTREDLPTKTTIYAFSENALWSANYSSYVTLTVGKSAALGTPYTTPFIVGIKSDRVVNRPWTISYEILKVEIEDETIATESVETLLPDKRIISLVAHKAGKTTVTVTLIPTWTATEEDTVSGEVISPQPIKCKFDIYVFEE